MPLRLIPVFLALAWGLNWPAVKIVLSAWPPFTLRTVSLGCGGLLLLGLALGQRKPLLPPRAAWRGALFGARLGTAKLPVPVLKRVLAVVLVIAAGKLVLV